VTGESQSPELRNRRQSSANLRRLDADCPGVNPAARTISTSKRRAGSVNRYLFRIELNERSSP
jgi:hypothetical protein